MSNYGFCRVCDEYDHLNRHTCPPRWRVWVRDRHEVGALGDGWQVYAKTARSAAEIAIATHNDEGQYVDCDTLVCVRLGDAGPESWFSVHGALSIDWSTKEAAPPEETQIEGQSEKAALQSSASGEVAGSSSLHHT